jgi:transcriptional regulator with XRE-family HTH domain
LSAQRSLIYEAADLGAQIRTARRERTLTQERAAELAGVSARLWNEVEVGKRPRIGLETALRMLHTLGLDVHVSTRAQASA